MTLTTQLEESALDYVKGKEFGIVPDLGTDLTKCTVTSVLVEDTLTGANGPDAVEEEMLVGGVKVIERGPSSRMAFHAGTSAEGFAPVPPTLDSDRDVTTVFVAAPGSEIVANLYGLTKGKGSYYMRMNFEPIF